MIRVVVTSETDDNQMWSGTLEPDITIGEIRQIWSNEYRKSLSSFEIQTTTEQPLDDTCRLADIPTVRRVVFLFITDLLQLSFRMMPGDRPPFFLPCLLSSTPAKLLPELRTHFGVEKDRSHRFKTAEDDVLDEDESFGEQAIGRDATIVIEFAVQIYIRSEWQDEDTHVFHRFPSDCLPAFPEPCHLRIVDVSLLPGTPVGDLSLVNDKECYVELCEPREMYILTPGHLRQALVSADNSLANHGVVEPQSACACAAEPREENKSKSKSESEGFSEILHETTPLLPTTSHLESFSAGCLVLADLVSFKLEFGKSFGCRVVRLSRTALVGELRARAVALAQSRDVALFHRARRLSDLRASLSEIGIDGDSVVKVRKEPPLVVKVKTLSGGDAELEVPPDVHRLYYGDLRVFHAAEERRRGFPCNPRAPIVFRCDGCKRCIVPEEEDFQTVPSKCCKRRSLALTAVLPQEERGTQTSLRKEIDVSTQSSVYTEEKGAQTDLRTTHSQLSEDPGSVYVPLPQHLRTTRRQLSEDPRSAATPLPQHLPTRRQLSENPGSVVAPLPQHTSSPPRRCTRVSFEIWQPDGQTEKKTLSCNSGEDLQDLLRIVANECNFSMEELNFCFRLERIYPKNKLLRCSKYIQKSGGKVLCFFLSDDGVQFRTKEAYYAKIHTQVSEFGDLPFSNRLPDLIPVVCILVSCLFIEITPRNQFSELPCGDATLNDARFVAWIEVFRVTDIDGIDKEAKFFVAGANWSMVSLDSGKIYESRLLAFEETSIPAEKRREERVLVLLKNDSPLPKWPIPPNTEMPIAIREGVEVGIEDRVLRVERDENAQVLSKRWVYHCEGPYLAMKNAIIRHIAT